MELVELQKKEIWADSHLVARKFGYKHANLVSIIKNVHGSIEKFKGHSESPLSQPKTFTEEREYRGTRYTSYMMNRQFFSLLVMRMKGQQAYEWQLKFNDAFYEMERHIVAAQTNATDTNWLNQRQQGKLVRREETDVIKEFVDYATEQGSQSAKFYYKHITNATYAALNLLVQRKPKLRDTLDLYEVSELLLTERFVRDRLQHYMRLERNYKDIYTSVKKDTLQYGEALKLGQVRGKING